MNQPLFLTEDTLLPESQSENILFFVKRSVFKLTCNQCGYSEIVGNQESSFSYMSNIQKDNDCRCCHSDNLSLSVKTKLNQP